MNNKAILIASATAYAKAFFKQIDHSDNGITSLLPDIVGPDLPELTAHGSDRLGPAIHIDDFDSFDDFHPEIVPFSLPQIRTYPIHDKKSGVNPAILHDLKADINQVRSVINPYSWL